MYVYVCTTLNFYRALDTPPLNATSDHYGDELETNLAEQTQDNLKLFVHVESVTTRILGENGCL